jgi:small GTP-binding protein
MKAKFVLIGDSGVGKTCLFEKFQNKNYEVDQASTVAGAFASVTVEENGKLVEFSLCDTAGQEKFRHVVPIYFKNSMYILAV